MNEISIEYRQKKELFTTNFKTQNKLPKNESVSMLIPWASTLALLYNKRVLNSIAFATELNL